MKKMKVIQLSLLLIGFFMLPNSSEAQFKVWNAPGRGVKSQGMYCYFQKKEGTRPYKSFTAGLMNISSVVDIGWNVLTNLINRDPKMFSAEMETYNSLNYGAFDEPLEFDIVSKTYLKGKNTEELMSSYQFMIELDEREGFADITVALKGSQVEWLPVRLKRNYQLIESDIEFTFTGYVKKTNRENGVSVIEEIELGKMSFSDYAFAMSEMPNTGYSLSVPIERGEEDWKLLNIGVTAKLSYENPVGKTTHFWQDFLTENEDALKGLIE